VRNLVALAVLGLAASGCAAQHYGRLSPLPAAHVETMTCADIAADLHRVEGFLFEVNAAPARLIPTTTQTRNRRERDAARASAETRRAQLLAAQDAQRCDVLRGRATES